jgi:hypothetical protein
MLELRPTCENCDTPLPPGSTEARICTFECTFCAECVDSVCHNICPNCGGGFERRPIRPVTDWKNGNHLGRHPATAKVTHHPIDVEDHRQLAERVGDRAPEER